MEPKVHIEQDGPAHAQRPDRWVISWNIQNLGAAPLRVLAARLPHGKFRSEEKLFEPPLDIPANENGRIEIKACCGEAPGAEVENAFVILRVNYVAAPWLILARLRIRIDDRGKPASTTELITVQPVGFSERRAG
jgi:hypothetical protein